MIIHDMEQRSEAWYKIRHAIPTASMFSKLLTPKTLKPSTSITEYAIDLANEVIAGINVDPWLGNVHSEHGKDGEEDAISMYEFEQDCDTQEVGFVTNDAKTYGCSPDRLVGDDGIMEIKNLKGNVHTRAIWDYHLTGECPTDYRLQVQGQLFVCERKWCDLVLHHPELPMKIIHVLPDINIQDKLAVEIGNVIKLRDQIVAVLEGDK